MMERNRIVYFDCLRILAMCFVIYMHVASLPLSMERDNEWILLTLVTSVAYTAVPLFFMMSGYLILTSNNTENISVLLKHRLPHLLVPLAFWTTVIAAWIGFKNGDMSLLGIIKTSFLGFSTPLMQHLWFVYTLVALYLMSPVLYYGLNGLKEKGKKYVICIIFFVFLQTMITILLPENMKETGMIRSLNELNFLNGTFWTFILGYFVGGMKRYVSNKLLVVIAVLDWGFISISTVAVSWQRGYTGMFQNQRAGFMVLLAICIFILFKQNIKGSPRIYPTANLSFGIYIIHNLINRILSYLGYEAYSLGEVVIKTVVILVVCYFIIKSMASIKPLCFLATGMSYDKACRSCNWIYTYNKVKNRTN